MNDALPANLRAARKRLAWTQAQLAAAARVTERTVQRAEAGEPPSAETLQALAGALDISIEELRRDTAKEAADESRVAEWLKTVTAKYSFIPLAKVSVSADWNALASADAICFECEVKDDAVQDAAAEFQQELRDWLDLMPGFDPIERRDTAKRLFGRVEEFAQIHDVAVAIGPERVRLKAEGGAPASWTVLYIVLSPLSDPRGFALRERTGSVRFQI